MKKEPHKQNLHKSDPVARYQKYSNSWKSQKAPGERAHSNLRWSVREHMLYHDQVVQKVSIYTGGSSSIIDLKYCISPVWAPGLKWAPGQKTTLWCESDVSAGAQKFWNSWVPGRSFGEIRYTRTMKFNVIHQRKFINQKQ